MATKLHPFGFFDSAHLAFQRLAERASSSFGAFLEQARNGTRVLLGHSPAQGDWIMALLLPTQWMAGAAALFSLSSTHTASLEDSYFVAGLLMLITVFLVLGFAGRAVTRYAAVFTQVVIAMLLPNAFGQGAESSLPYFLVALALLAIYRDYGVLCVAGGLVLLGSFLNVWAHLPAAQEMQAYHETFLILAETLILILMVRRKNAGHPRPALAPVDSH